jgi:multiple sugar transport system substrate-binding protein
MRTKRFNVFRKIILCISLLLSNCVSTSPTHEEKPALQTKTQIRWLAGLEFGVSTDQIAVLQEVVNQFNASQKQLDLILQVTTASAAYDLLATQISTGTGPDIVGPISWGMANNFSGQWLPLDSYIKASSFDLTAYDPSLIHFYQNEEGVLSLPFAAFPSAIYYFPGMFDEAGLDYPPHVYGEKYELDGQSMDWTWETLSKIAKRLTIDTNGFNATQPQFDRANIFQVGFSIEGQSANSLATFFGAAKISQGTPGNYISSMPNAWKTAWQWWYDAMWGTQPFMANGDLADTFEFGKGNVFNAGKSAMALSQASYLPNNGKEFQLAILPMSQDRIVHGRISEDSFYLWKGSTHPKEAFQVLTYLIGTGADQLLPAYHAMPAKPSKLTAFFTQKSTNYPFVTKDSWQVFVQGMAYADIPGADQYLPHRNEAIDRIHLFADKLIHVPDLNFDREFQELQDDLTIIYNKP